MTVIRPLPVCNMYEVMQVMRKKKWPLWIIGVLIAELELLSLGQNVVEL